MPRIVIVGDVGGCADQLERVVLPLADDPDTVVIQVGDLVDRGPDSAGVLRLVGGRLAAGRWVQLIGNHEAQYLGGVRFWPEPLSEADAAVLRQWWLREWLRVAAAVRTAAGEELLLCHAGLTVDAWRLLGAPVTAGTAADLLNTRPEPLLWDFDGPLWAEAGSRVYPSWPGCSRCRSRRCTGIPRWSGSVSGRGRARSGSGRGPRSTGRHGIP